MIDSFHFIRPFWLLALLPAAWVWWRAWRRRDASLAWKPLIAPHLLPHLLTGDSLRRHLQPIHLLAVVWVSSVIALSGILYFRKQERLFADVA